VGLHLGKAGKEPMPTYSYTSVQAHSGRRIRGRIHGGSRELVVAVLKSRGELPTRLDEAAPEVPNGFESRRVAAVWGRLRSRRASVGQVAWFTRQLSTLLASGLPLLQSLDLLARQEKSADFRSLLENLGEVVRTGGALSSGLEREPRAFDRLYVNLVKAGEVSGLLDTVLERLARFLEKSARLKARVTAAMVYPLVVGVVATLIVVALTVFVVPKFEQLFLSQLHGRTLPGLTRAVLGISRWVSAHGVGLLVGALLTGMCAFHLWRSPAVRAVSDRWILQVPGVGAVVLRARVARFARTLGTLLAAGVPILQALALTRAATGSPRLQRVLVETERKVEAGESLAVSLALAKTFPPVVPAMIEVGETTGKLPEMLVRLADIYDEEVDQTVMALTALLEPALIVAMAVVVGTVVLALFLPMVELIKGLSGG